MPLSGAQYKGCFLFYSPLQHYKKYRFRKKKDLENKLESGILWTKRSGWIKSNIKKGGKTGKRSTFAGDGGWITLFEMCLIWTDGKTSREKYPAGKRKKGLKLRHEIGQQQLCYLNISINQNTRRKYDLPDDLMHFSDQQKKISGHQFQKYRKVLALPKGAG